MSQHTSQIRIAIVDDHPGVRAGIKNLLAPADDIVVIGEGKNGAEAISLVEEKLPDILLLDVELPLMRGEEVARRLRKDHPEIKVLAVSSYNEPLYIQGMMQSGASGYITKDEAPAMLLEAIRSIYEEGKPWISPGAEAHAQKPTPQRETFTQRELDVLTRIVKGKTDLEISQELNIPEKIVDRYLRLLMVKFGVGSRTDLARSAAPMVKNHTKR